MALPICFFYSAGTLLSLSSAQCSSSCLAPGEWSSFMLYL